jgi:hypothetical protein
MPYSRSLLQQTALSTRSKRRSVPGARVPFSRSLLQQTALGWLAVSRRRRTRRTQIHPKPPAQIYNKRKIRQKSIEEQVFCYKEKWREWGVFLDKNFLVDLERTGRKKVLWVRTSEKISSLVGTLNKKWNPMELEEWIKSRAFELGYKNQMRII